MTEEIVRQLNWVDALLIVVFIRIIFIGQSKGLMIEAFKFFGIICSIFISLQYYSVLSEFINSHSSIPIDFADFISLIGLIVLVLIIFKFTRDGILFLIKISPHPTLEKWGGLFISMIRGFFVASLVILCINLSTIEYFQKSAKSSFSGQYLLSVCPRTYAYLFENLVSKFSPNEKLNSKIFKSLN